MSRYVIRTPFLDNLYKLCCTGHILCGATAAVTAVLQLEWGVSVSFWLGSVAFLVALLAIVLEADRLEEIEYDVPSFVLPPLIVTLFLAFIAGLVAVLIEGTQSSLVAVVIFFSSAGICFGLLNRFAKRGPAVRAPQSKNPSAVST